MLHPIFEQVADRIFLHDPVLRKLVKRIQEEGKDDKNTESKEVSKRD